MALEWVACTHLIPFIPFLLLLFSMYNNFFISFLKENLLVFRALMNSHRIHDWFTENGLSVNGNLHARGPWLSGMSFLVTCDPENVRHILTQNFQNYPKGDDFNEIFETLGDGIINTDGESWRYQRQKLQLAMSQKVFRAFIATTTKEKIQSALLPFLSATVERGLMIDLEDMFVRLTFDTTCILSFGTDTGSLSIDLPDVPFARAVDVAAATIFSRIIRPATWWKINKYLGIGQEKQQAKAQVVIDEFVAEAIERRKQEMIEGKLACPDLLSSYLSDEDIPKSPKFLKDNVVNFLVAGRDTISSGLTWFFWVISQNKQAEEKIFHELCSVRHNITPEGMKTFDLEELENLVYLTAAFMECLRLYPLIPLDFKTVLKPDLLPSGFTVTPGMKIILSAYATGRMQKTWGEDCLEFKPERWINSEKRTLKHVPSYKYPVFSTGPRYCLGKNMALTQMKMVAATMLYNFCFEVVEGHVVEPALHVALHMKNGLMMRIRRRTSICIDN